jgi:N4-gp56 family major capsid protein
MDHLCGNTGQSFANTPDTPDSDHYVVSGDVGNNGTITTDEGNLGTNDQFALADIDYCIEQGKTITPPMRPCRIDGGEYWVCILHPYSVVDMRLDCANSAYITWPDIQMYANKRGLNNPIFTGALGVYNNTIIYENTRLYSYTANTRRNLFLGAQAGVFAIGNAYDSIETQRVGKDNLMSWYEQTDDFGNEKGISVGCIFGITATRFNSKDFGKIVICSYAAAHS